MDMNNQNPIKQEETLNLNVAEFKVKLEQDDSVSIQQETLYDTNDIYEVKSGYIH